MKRRAILWLATAALAALALPAAAQAPAQPAASATTYILYASPTSRRVFENDPVDIKVRTNRWRDLVRARGATFAIATHPAQLAQLPRAVALIVPSAIALSDEERRLIGERVDAGESLLATWMPGTVDGKGAALKTGFIESVFKVATRPAPADDRGFLITVGDTPLTYALPAGTRVWVGRDKRFATAVLATPGAGYLADWARTPDQTGLLYYTTVGGSRRALLGWSEGMWDGQPAEFTRLANLALDFVEGRPIVFARSWPWPYRGALTIGVDALWRFENVPRIAELLSKHGVHGSFHFLPESAEANKALIQDLVKAKHSIGGFGDAPRPFAGQPEAEQRTRIQRMLAGFRSSLGPEVAVSGLRAPQGSTDAATEKAAESLDYIVDIGRVDAAMPVMAASRRPVVLSATANIDTTASREAIEKSLGAAKARAQFLGGYAFLGVDGAGFNRDSTMEAELARFVAATWEGSKEVWPASSAAVATWWRQREGVTVASAWDARESALDVTVSARDAVAYPVAVALVAPAGRPNARLEPEVAGVQLVTDAKGEAALVFNALPPGEQRLRLRFLP